MHSSTCKQLCSGSGVCVPVQRSPCKPKHSMHCDVSSTTRLKGMKHCPSVTAVVRPQCSRSLHSSKARRGGHNCSMTELSRQAASFTYSDQPQLMAGTNCVSLTHMLLHMQQLAPPQCQPAILRTPCTPRLWKAHSSLAVSYLAP